MRNKDNLKILRQLIGTKIINFSYLFSYPKNEEIGEQVHHLPFGCFYFQIENKDIYVLSNYDRHNPKSRSANLEKTKNDPEEHEQTINTGEAFAKQWIGKINQKIKTITLYWKNDDETANNLYIQTIKFTFENNQSFYYVCELFHPNDLNREKKHSEQEYEDDGFLIFDDLFYSSQLSNAYTNSIIAE